MILSDFGIKRPTTVTMIFLAITVLGLIAMMTLKMDLMPNVDIPIVVVMAEYRGVGPREIESMVTKTLESAVSQVPDIKNV
jgi:HAE1 family hydrophobic/amphiphilic exporter-1